jgi:hypothetical protein
MPVPPPTRAVLRLAAAALVGFWAARGLPAAPEAASEAFFETHVRPLLVEKCVTCHGDKKSESGLRLDSLAGLLRGGESGPAIVPGKAGESLLVSVLKHGGDIQMPGVDPASATRFLELRSSSVMATMLGHGVLWGIMISGAQMALVLAAVLLFRFFGTFSGILTAA